MSRFSLPEKRLCTQNACAQILSDPGGGSDRPASLTSSTSSGAPAALRRGDQHDTIEEEDGPVEEESDCREQRGGRRRENELGAAVAVWVDGESEQPGGQTPISHSEEVIGRDGGEEEEGGGHGENDDARGGVDLTTLETSMDGNRGGEHERDVVVAEDGGPISPASASLDRPHGTASPCRSDDANSANRCERLDGGSLHLDIVPPLWNNLRAPQAIMVRNKRLLRVMSVVAFFRGVYALVGAGTVRANQCIAPITQTPMGV